MEIWKTIPGFSKFEASSLGNIRHTKHKKIRKATFSRGYPRYTIPSDEGIIRPYLGHRLVYIAFKGSIPDGVVIDHINRVRNDNRPENLRELSPIRNSNNIKKSHYPVALRRIDKIIELYDTGLTSEEIHQELKKHPL